ncbi:putative allantoicase [Zancudomyces culisetae]|uniref:Putative allantoicase n=1 Tax=Zancudomyces culisetae TaxID=1213189 RepID=A0A1R1PUK9_ZANCU|nr:putative allantoicase [Zancudomyces culisetae]|eukprot:OMH84635.1 putative allantoicase [Zancudomyces culisetae]
MGAETACKVRIDGCLVPSEIGSPKKKKGELPFIWEPLLPLVEMKADRVHKLALWNETETVYNYIKVYIVPDGGISRLRVLGTVAPPLEVNKEIDLACVTNGAVVISATDETYGKKENLILPGYSKEEGTQGWITKRNRAAEKPSESAIIKLGDAGLLSHAVIETNNFIGNHPVEACIMACNSLSSNPESDPNCFWYQILSKKPLDPNTQNKFVLSLPKEPFSHVKLTIYPDGAVSRLRIFGHCVDPSSETSEDESTETATPNVEKPASTPSKPEPVVITPKRSGKKSAGSSHKRTTSSASNSAESPTRAKRGKNN